MTDREILEQILGKVDFLEDEVKTLKTEVRHTRVLIESDVAKKIQLVAEQHSDIIKNFKALEDYPETRGRVATLENAVKIHTKDIAKIKKAVG